MEIYQSVIITDSKGSIITKLDNIYVKTIVSINKDAIPIYGGQKNQLIDLVNGKNEINVILFGIKEMIKDVVKNQKINIYLMENDIQIDILNVIPKFEENNLMVTTPKICKKIKRK